MPRPLVPQVSRVLVCLLPARMAERHDGEEMLRMGGVPEQEDNLRGGREMQIIISVGVALLLWVYIMGALLCHSAFDDIGASITPLTLAICFVPILHWYYVFKYLEGGWRSWLEYLKESINEYNEYKELD